MVGKEKKKATYIPTFVFASKVLFFIIILISDCTIFVRLHSGYPRKHAHTNRIVTQTGENYTHVASLVVS